jgi:hypothetical protein
VEVGRDHHGHVGRVDAEQRQPVGRRHDRDLAEPVARRDVVAGVEQHHGLPVADDPEVVLHVQFGVGQPVPGVVVEHDAAIDHPLAVLDLDDFEACVVHLSSIGSIAV